VNSTLYGSKKKKNRGKMQLLPSFIKTAINSAWFYKARYSLTVLKVPLNPD